MSKDIDDLAERMIAAAKNYDEATRIMVDELKAFSIAHGMAFKRLVQLLAEEDRIDRDELISLLMLDASHVQSREEDEPIAKAFGRLIYLLREEGDMRN